MSEWKQSILIADRWRDYELIDSGGGRRLERWGDVRLIRPDPLAIWKCHSPELWRRVDACYHRHASGGGRWEVINKLPNHWILNYQPLKLRFKVRLTGFKHTGLFPEQAANWEVCSKIIRNASHPVRLLNLFGYTGAATAAAAAAGAHVCHVDAARGMVQWCRENLDICGLAEAPVRYIVDDCIAFVRREQRRGRRYHALIMDPPSFGRGSRGEVWKLEDQLSGLLQESVKLLEDTPLFLLINTYTTGLSPRVLANIIGDVMPVQSGAISCGELGLPETAGGRILPCGVFARWQAGVDAGDRIH